MFDRLIAILDRVLTAALIVLVVMMVLSITTEIVLNAMVQPVASVWMNSYSGSQTASPEWLEDVMAFVANASAPVNTASQTLLVWIGILGSALAFRMRSHLGVDALVRLYPPKVRLCLDYASTVSIGLFSLLVMTIGGWQVAGRAFEMGSKMPGMEFLNRGWFYLVLIFAGVLNLIYCIYHIMHPKPVSGWSGDEKETPSS